MFTMHENAKHYTLNYIDVAVTHQKFNIYAYVFD